MPTISMFYGIIIISIFYESNSHHDKPHVHVRYKGRKAAIAINDGSILIGELPEKQLKMVQEWINLHKGDLIVDWELAALGEELFRIAPLLQ